MGQLLTDSTLEAVVSVVLAKAFPHTDLNFIQILQQQSLSKNIIKLIVDQIRLKDGESAMAIARAVLENPAVAPYTDIIAEVLSDIAVPHCLKIFESKQIDIHLPSGLELFNHAVAYFNPVVDPPLAPSVLKVVNDMVLTHCTPSGGEYWSTRTFRSVEVELLLQLLRTDSGLCVTDAEILTFLNKDTSDCILNLTDDILHELHGIYLGRSSSFQVGRKTPAHVLFCILGTLCGDNCDDRISSACEYIRISSTIPACPFVMKYTRLEKLQGDLRRLSERHANQILHSLAQIPNGTTSNLDGFGQAVWMAWLYATTTNMLERLQKILLSLMQRGWKPNEDCNWTGVLELLQTITGHGPVPGLDNVAESAAMAGTGPAESATEACKTAQPVKVRSVSADKNNKASVAEQLKSLVTFLCGVYSKPGIMDMQEKALVYVRSMQVFRQLQTFIQFAGGDR